MLLLERGHHRHHRLDKPRALGTLRAKAAFAPQDTWTDGALGHIVSRLDAFHTHKGPQGIIDLEYFPTDTFRLGHTTGLPRLEQPRHVAPQRAHQAPELRVCQRAIADLMPPVEHLAGLGAQRFPKLLRAAPTLDHGFEIAQQMRPADLTPPGRIPMVRTPAIRHQD